MFAGASTAPRDPPGLVPSYVVLIPLSSCLMARAGQESGAQCSREGLFRLPWVHMGWRPTSTAALTQTSGEATQPSWASTPKHRNLKTPKTMPCLRAGLCCLWEGPRVFLDWQVGTHACPGLYVRRWGSLAAGLLWTVLVSWPGHSPPGQVLFWMDA